MMPTVYARVRGVWHVALKTYPSEAVIKCSKGAREPAEMFATDPRLGGDVRPEVCSECIAP